MVGEAYRRAIYTSVYSTRARRVPYRVVSGNGLSHSSSTRNVKDGTYVRSEKRGRGVSANETEAHRAPPTVTTATATVGKTAAIRMGAVARTERTRTLESTPRSGRGTTWCIIAAHELHYDARELKFATREHCLTGERRALGGFPEVPGKRCLCT